MIIRFAVLLSVLLYLTACGGGSSAGHQDAVSSTATSLSNSSVLSSAPASLVSSSSLSSSSSSQSSVSTSVPSSTASSLATSVVVGDTLYVYCVSTDQDPDGDGWGWTGSASCIVRNGKADPNGNGSAISGPIDLTGIQISNDLVNPNATAKTLVVYRYLKSIFGKKTLSGQQDLTWDDSIDMRQRVINDTGKAPAIMGFDFMNYAYSPFTQDGGSGKQQIEEAIAQWARGGLVTFCWHWRDPHGASADFYTKDTSFRIPMSGDALDKSVPAFTEIEADVDYIAGQLKRLQDAGVSVLWRPLHEAGGGWFWWGGARTDSTTPEQAQVALYRYIFDRLTRFHGLNNLIWVWNGQGNSWYPGDAYVDIIGQDIYGAEKDYGSRAVNFSGTLKYDTADKMIAMTENGSISNPDNMKADNAWWLYFLTWNDGSGAEGITNKSNFWTGEYHNSNSHKTHVFNHPLVITLDELPVW